MQDFHSSLIKAVFATMSSLGVVASVVGQTHSKCLSSAAEVTVHIGLTGSLGGNILLALPREAAFGLTSAMRHGDLVADIDDRVMSALGELVHMTISAALLDLQAEKCVSLTPPTLTTGSGLSVDLCGGSSTTLHFEAQDLAFSLSYCVQ